QYRHQIDGVEQPVDDQRRRISSCIPANLGASAGPRCKSAEADLQTREHPRKHWCHSRKHNYHQHELSVRTDPKRRSHTLVAEGPRKERRPIRGHHAFECPQGGRLRWLEWFLFGGKNLESGNCQESTRAEKAPVLGGQVGQWSFAHECDGRPSLERKQRIL